MASKESVMFEEELLLFVSCGYLAVLWLKFELSYEQQRMTYSLEFDNYLVLNFFFQNIRGIRGGTRPAMSGNVIMIGTTGK